MYDISQVRLPPAGASDPYRGGLRRAGDMYWEEAVAWAQAVACHEWFRVEPRGGLENPGGRVFRYTLTETVHNTGLVSSWIRQPTA